MEFILASIGRCASTVIADLIKEASGCELVYARLHSGIEAETDRNYVCLFDRYEGVIKKTHAPLTREIEFDYRAIYLYRDFGCVVASLYKQHVVTEHYRNLEVKERHIRNFLRILRSKFRKGRRQRAFLYLVIGDKFRFNESFASWKRSPKTLFVRYEDLCQDPKEVMGQMSAHLGVDLPGFEVKPSTTSRKDLPWLLRLAVKLTYG